MASSEGNDRLGDRLGFLRAERQMHMVGHQRTGIRCATVFLQRCAQPIQVCVVILLCEKAGFAVVAVLHDVRWYVVEMGARAAGFGDRLAEIIEPGPFNPYTHVAQLAAKRRAAAAALCSSVDLLHRLCGGDDKDALVLTAQAV